MYGYVWTDEYGIFRLTPEAKVQKEIRPVFKEELDFFHMDAYWDYPNTDAPLLWAEGIRRYVMNGECVAEAVGGGFYTKPIVKLNTDKRLQLHPIDTDRLYEVNAPLMTSLEQRAISFIQTQYTRYQPQGYAFVCAFSGGKDSLALLNLTAKALAPDEFFVIFSNTGMELSDTLRAVDKAKKRWSSLHFYEAKCHMEPTESWDEFGPPGRRMRWCCAVHKSVPTILKLREITGDYNTKAVVYDGVRAEESARRAKYDEISEGAKNISQVNCSPIHKWNTAELFCYLLKNQLMINKAYRVGLFRVGCKVCPLSSDWWDGIANDYYRPEMESLLTRVESYANKTKPAKEVRKYIEGGGWKARMGGRGLPNGGNRVSEGAENDTITLIITIPTQRWSDVAPILGTFVELSSEGGLQRIDGVNYEYRIQADKDRLTVSYRPYSKMDRYVISHLRGVANKVGYCRGCRACMVQCPTGAFTIQPDGRIQIRESICCHCSNCISYVERGCMLSKSLSTTKGGIGMDMKGMNAYQHFGLRQAWLEHFFSDGIDCFGESILGTRQYDALKVWLRDAGMTVIKDKALTITPLCEKLTPIGPYNPFTWAIIWANLAYNSVICKWYCLNSEIGVAHDKGELIMMISEEYSKSTRDNAVTSLLETLKCSPLGGAIGQGIVIVNGIRNSYLRTGYETPDAVALLYSLYLYAEHTKHYTLTLTELIRAHESPNAPGISPSDVFGIEPRKFREAVQGLALAYPKQIRVSFVNDLDNIVLDSNITSLSILDLAEK